MRDTECGGHINEPGDERKKSIRVATTTSFVNIRNRDSRTCAFERVSREH